MLMEIEEETLLRTRDGAACSGVQQRAHCQRGKTTGCQGKIPNTKWLLAGVCNGFVVKQKMCNRRSPVFRTMVQTMEWVSSERLTGRMWWLEGGDEGSLVQTLVYTGASQRQEA